ncbi:MAG: ribonuclease P protein component [Hydrogenothermaceae bacterium]|nr:ribonuclease P protein component [Hydrogenothermaceae bacterium]
MIVLKNKKEISELFSQKNRLQFEDFTVVFRQNQLGYPRFLFVAPKKIFKLSVKRNRVKRLLRQAVRSALDEYKNLSCDIILVGKQYILNKKSYEVENQIRSAFKELEKLC